MLSIGRAGGQGKSKALCFPGREGEGGRRTDMVQSRWAAVQRATARPLGRRRRRLGSKGAGRGWRMRPTARQGDDRREAGARLHSPPWLRAGKRSALGGRDSSQRAAGGGVAPDTASSLLPTLLNKAPGTQRRRGEAGGLDRAGLVCKGPLARERGSEGARDARARTTRTYQTAGRCD